MADHPLDRAVDLVRRREAYVAPVAHDGALRHHLDNLLDHPAGLLDLLEPDEDPVVGVAGVADRDVPVEPVVEVVRVVAPDVVVYAGRPEAGPREAVSDRLPAAYRSHALRPVDEYPVLLREPQDVLHRPSDLLDAARELRLSPGGQFPRHAPDARVVRSEPGAREGLDPVGEELPRVEEIPEVRKRAYVHEVGAVCHEVVPDAAHLADEHAYPLRPLRDLKPQELLDRHAVADVVHHRRAVVEAVGVGDDGVPGVVFRLLLEAAVQIAYLRHGFPYPLPVELAEDPEASVHRRMRGAEVQIHP